jgi:hypothetical protein
MSEVNETDLPTGMLAPDSSRQWKWSIKFDEPLRALIVSEGIEDPDHQVMVCEVLCRIDLAKHRMFGENTDTIESQHHCYTSTKRMRKLAEKCQL